MRNFLVHIFLFRGLNNFFIAGELNLFFRFKKQKIFMKKKF